MTNLDDLSNRGIRVLRACVSVKPAVSQLAERGPRGLLALIRVKKKLRVSDKYPLLKPLGTRMRGMATSGKVKISILLCSEEARSSAAAPESEKQDPPLQKAQRWATHAAPLG
jgi:hypothetical protein